MVVIALLLLIAGTAVTVSVILENGENQTFEVFGVNVDATIAGVFVAGMGTMLALALGLYLLKLVAAKSHRRRQEVKALKRDKNDEVSRLEAERARLAEDKAKLEEEVARRDAEAAKRRAAAAPPLVTQPAAVPSTGAHEASSDGEHRSMFDKALGRHAERDANTAATEETHTHGTGQAHTHRAEARDTTDGQANR